MRSVRELSTLSGLKRLPGLKAPGGCSGRLARKTMPRQSLLDPVADLDLLELARPIRRRAKSVIDGGIDLPMPKGATGFAPLRAV